MGACHSKKSKDKVVRSQTKRFSVTGKDFSDMIKGKVIEDYVIIKRLGTGGYGEVRLGRHKTTDEQMAVKTINLSTVTESQIDRILEEVKILRLLSHPNIIEVFDVYIDSKSLSIVTEYCRGGDLIDKINANNGIQENDAVVYMKQIVSAVKYCHSKGIVHRDLKPENILITKDPIIKVIDFGNAVHFTKGEVMQKCVGTPAYMAPELIKGKYDEKCDVWSLGITLYAMLSGSPPFVLSNEQEIYNRIKNNQINMTEGCWASVSEDAKDCVRKMLTKNPINRPTIDEIYQHKWLESCDESKISNTKN
ncbi:unnamed protein product [Blepharisma stoltei]|uniref:non-specific serine/threonine protein kinase n=1 Tax=Blepharisma stoltei TaxID=1481888 RepID=A0AAU9JB51_9CILI|nr:unnamed protein product [Blepharisma stoltei]